jgi:ABC-2 type transport system permease protein
MRAYWAIFSARFRMLLQYRAAAFAGCVTQVFWGLIRVMIFTAFFASTTAPQPMALDDVITYAWLGQAMLALILFGADGDVQGMIRNGTIAYEMVRPMDLYRTWYCRAVAQRAAPLILRMIPIFIVAGVFFGMKAPASTVCGMLWVVATGAAVLLAAAVGTIMTISLLWTISGDGILRLLPAAIWFFSGITVPLPLFPDWAQPVLALMPFRGLGDTPWRIYLGHIPPSEATLAIAHQLVWALLLALLGHWLLSRGVRRLVVQGG